MIFSIQSHIGRFVSMFFGLAFLLTRTELNKFSRFVILSQKKEKNNLVGNSWGAKTQYFSLLGEPFISRLSGELPWVPASDPNSKNSTSIQTDSWVFMTPKSQKKTILPTLFLVECQNYIKNYMIPTISKTNHLGEIFEFEWLTISNLFPCQPQGLSSWSKWLCGFLAPVPWWRVVGRWGRGFFQKRLRICPWQIWLGGIVFYKWPSSKNNITWLKINSTASHSFSAAGGAVLDFCKLEMLRYPRVIARRLTWSSLNLCPFYKSFWKRPGKYCHRDRWDGLFSSRVCIFRISRVEWPKP